MVHSEIVRLTLFTLSAIAFLVILLAETAHIVAAPLYAMVAAASLTISLILRTHRRWDEYFYMGTLFLSAASGLLASLHWLASVEEATSWRLMMWFLFLVSSVAILHWVFWLEELSE